MENQLDDIKWRETKTLKRILMTLIVISMVVITPATKAEADTLHRFICNHPKNYQVTGCKFVTAITRGYCNQFSSQKVGIWLDLNFKIQVNGNVEFLHIHKFICGDRDFTNESYSILCKPGQVMDIEIKEEK